MVDSEINGIGASSYNDSRTEYSHDANVEQLCARIGQHARRQESANVYIAWQTTSRTGTHRAHIEWRKSSDQYSKKEVQLRIDALSDGSDSFGAATQRTRKKSREASEQWIFQSAPAHPADSYYATHQRRRSRIGKEAEQGGHIEARS